MSQHTAFGPLVTPQTLGPDLEGDQRFTAGQTELADGSRFFDHFRGRLHPSALAGLDILDLGCGYGGRTVFYARECGASHVTGIEPFETLVRLCDEFAQSLECPNVSFSVARAEALPFADQQFDAVISFDVLEHVQDPAQSFSEIRRVLKPGGRAWLAFPTYRGARSSHLDFITRIPALHRIFDPETIVSVVNDELRSANGRYGIRELPPPAVSSLGYLPLPTLNGLSRRDARRLIARTNLELVYEAVSPFVRQTDPLPGARTLSRLLDSWQHVHVLPELLIGSLAYELRR